MPQTLLPTSELLIQIRAKTRPGAEALYDQYAMVLRFAIFRILRKQELTNNILEKTFCEIWDTAGLYNEQERPLLAWMLGIAKNEALKQVIATSPEPKDTPEIKLKLA